MMTCGRPTSRNDSGFNQRISRVIRGWLRGRLTSTEGSDGGTHNSPSVVVNSPSVVVNSHPVVPNTVCSSPFSSADLLSSGPLGGPPVGRRDSRRRRKCPPGERKDVNTQTETEQASRTRSVTLERRAARVRSAELRASGAQSCARPERSIASRRRRRPASHFNLLSYHDDVIII